MFLIFKKTGNLILTIRHLLILLCLLPACLCAQNNVWIKINQGEILNLDPQQMQWVPLSEKQQIPVNSYLLTKPGTEAILFENTELYQLPPDAYFYVNDIFKRDRIGIVAALTQIEAEQLPENIKAPTQDKNKPIGLTYGKLQKTTENQADIPHEKQRMNAVSWFYERNQFDAALLSLKRMLARFPGLLLNEHYADKLFFLYDKFQLYGFLFNESSQLLTLKQSEAFTKIVKSWNETAKHNLHGTRLKD